MLDPVAALRLTTQNKTFIWEHKKMHMPTFPAFRLKPNRPIHLHLAWRCKYISGCLMRSFCFCSFCLVLFSTSMHSIRSDKRKNKMRTAWGQTLTLGYFQAAVDSLQCFAVRLNYIADGNQSQLKMLYCLVRTSTTVVLRTQNLLSETNVKFFFFFFLNLQLWRYIPTFS